MSHSDPKRAAGAVLAIDAGNTRIKWGLHADATWDLLPAIATAEAGELRERARALPTPFRIVASNVAGAAVREVLEQVARDRAAGLTIIGSRAAQLGVSNGYDHPGQLGTDRWAALVAAHHSEPGHKIVVNAGTALTIDALQADGRFRGGLIVPGPAMMRRSLDRGTAGLRLTEGAYAAFPRSTPDAITTGALQAAIGAITRMGEAMSSDGAAPGCIVLSGGAAPELVPHLPLPVRIRENLVLDGLYLIARDPTA